MRRTLERFRSAWATWRMWRANYRFFRRVAFDTAGYFTAAGIVATDREVAYDEALDSMMPGATIDLLDPEHTIKGQDPFGRFARSLHGDTDA